MFRRGIAARCLLLVCCWLLGSTCAIASRPLWQERSDWQPFFSATGLDGTLVVLDARRAGGEKAGQAPLYWVYNGSRARRAYSPASTFKLPHTLFALDAGVVTGAEHAFAWDGQQRSFASWNRDHTLRSALRASVVWVYQQIARDLGEPRERAYLRKLRYGNRSTAGGLEHFWLTGGLRISARQQIDFLRRLQEMRLPFKRVHQELLQDLMIVDAGSDWTLRGKTGWVFESTPQIGWWIGWIDTVHGPVYVALNIDMPDPTSDLPKREAIVRAVLRSLDALPAAEQAHQ